MSVDKENKIFYKTYNKLMEKLEDKVLKYSIKRKYGSNIDYKEIKRLNMFTHYLDSVRKSDYKYYYVDSLTEISNYLNRI